MVSRLAPGTCALAAPAPAITTRCRVASAASCSRGSERTALRTITAGEKLTAADVVKRTRAKTLNGKRVRFRVRGANVYVNGARVTTADVGASNGVLHVINRVLLPG